MTSIKYKYAYDENGVLVSIQDVDQESKQNNTYHCISCGKILLPKLGIKNVHHFAHKSTCNGESYLHKLAKLKLKEKFYSQDCSFKVNLPTVSICNQKNTCPFFHEGCKTGTINEINLREYYNQCEEEISIHIKNEHDNPIVSFSPLENGSTYVADLLLWNKEKPENTPIAIEIYCSHECEEQKIKSGLRIIEIKIDSEEDIEKLIKNDIGGDNVSFFNFHPKIGKTFINNVNVFSRFALFKSGAALLSTIEDYQYCKDRHIKKNRYSIAELNIGGGNTCGFENTTTYRLAFAYLIKHGYNIRNCMLCKYYKSYEESYTMEPFCANYKRSSIRNPKQKDASSCNCFELNEKMIQEYSDVASNTAIELV